MFLYVNYSFPPLLLIVVEKGVVFNIKKCIFVNMFFDQKLAF